MANTVDHLGDLFQSCFLRNIDQKFFSEIQDFSERYFYLFALKQRCWPERALPPISGSVGARTEAAFDWSDFLRRSTATLRVSVPPDRLNRYLSRRIRGGDVRNRTRLHSTAEFVWERGKRTGFVPKNVTLEELTRHLNQQFWRLIERTRVTAMIRNRLASLKLDS